MKSLLFPYFIFFTASFTQNYMFGYGDSGFNITGHYLEGTESNTKVLSIGFILGGKLSLSFGRGGEELKSGSGGGK